MVQPATSHGRKKSEKMLKFLFGRGPPVFAECAILCMQGRNAYEQRRECVDHMPYCACRDDIHEGGAGPRDSLSLLADRLRTGLGLCAAQLHD